MEIRAAQQQVNKSSYKEALRSSAIVGGAQGGNYLLGMVRTKLVAVLLGPAGVGAIGMYQSALGVMGTICGLGIGSSGVREVAEAHGSGDVAQMARTVKTLRRVCWITGALGWLLTAAFAWPLSVWAFGTGDRATEIACLGATLLLTAVSTGQSALLQGVRRIGDLARLSVLGALGGTVLGVGLYAWMGERGIIPVLVGTSAVNLLLSWRISRRVRLAEIKLSWGETVQASRRLISLGASFMWGALLTNVVGLTIRGVIVRDFGLVANGVYQAAWGISGMFGGFILGAMGTDFYPRLTAVAKSNDEVNRLVNEQAEVGILLALPGLLATIAFAPAFMGAFYSREFLPGAELLPWFVAGVFGQVIGWPMGFIQRAKGATFWIYLSQTHANVAHLLLSLVLMKVYGVTGAAVAFAAMYPLHNIVTYIIARRLSAFRWSRTSMQLMIVAGLQVAAGWAVHVAMPVVPGIVVGGALSVASLVFSMRGIASRLGREQRLVKMVRGLPGGRLLCGA